MITIVWEFTVKEEAIAEFQRAYGPTGDWAALFRQHPGYEGTLLLQDTTRKERFLTIDRWQNESQLSHMRNSGAQEYSRLDVRFAELTVSERELGVFRAL
jgi:heme-degrading monooxygenase HmoA